jgi:PPE-repeat protein
MEFATLPPEVISALIHAGPGSDSLANASAAWQQLSATLEDAADNYAATVSSLTDSWYGPSSTAMLQAVAPYLKWLRTTAQQSQQTATAAQSAAAAVNAVRAAVIPTATVQANRQRLAQLLATNTFGRNLPAIAQTEADYQAMWANNSAAMTRYQAASSQASVLPQLTSPTSVADPTATSTPASAVPAAATTSTASATPAASTPFQDLLTEIENSSFYQDVAALQSFNSIFNNSADALGPNANLYNTIFSSGFPINLLSYLAQNQSAQALQSVSSGVSQGVSEGENALGGAAGSIGGGAAEALGALGQSGQGLGALGAAGLGQINTSAALGAAVPMGSLSVPPSAAPLLQAPVQLASAATPLGGGVGAGMPMLPPLMPPPISAGSGWRKRKAQKYEDISIGAELKGKVMKPPPSAG